MPEKTADKPKDTKKVKEQRDLEGQPTGRDVQTEEKMNTTYTFRANHFQLKVGARGLDSILEVEDATKRRKKLEKKVKARPEVEEIPPGTKKHESEMLVSKAEHTNPRGKFD